jgi:hypothetical protein
MKEYHFLVKYYHMKIWIWGRLFVKTATARYTTIVWSWWKVTESVHRQNMKFKYSTTKSTKHISTPNPIVTMPSTVLPTVTSLLTPSNNKQYFSTTQTAAVTTTPAVNTAQLAAVTATSQAPETRQENVEGKLKIFREIQRVLTVLRIFMG